MEGHANVYFSICYSNELLNSFVRIVVLVIWDSVDTFAIMFLFIFRCGTT